MHSTTRVFSVSLALIFLVFSLVTSAAIAEAFAGQTTRVSVSSAGVTADSSASSGVISADGRYVVFSSGATNLIAGVVSTTTHVYRHRLGGATELVSRGTTGNPGNNVSRFPSVSEDGRYVVFTSYATDLVDGDTNGLSDVFMRDMDSPATAPVTWLVSSAGVPANGSSGLSGLSGEREISNDGRYVVFTSFATNLATGTNNGSEQVYVKDMTSGETPPRPGAVVRASVNNATPAQAGDRPSQTPSISGNGLFVAFTSAATNFSPDSTSGIRQQVFVRDLRAGGVTTLESPGAAAVARSATAPVLSDDGQSVAFVTDARLDLEDLDNGVPDVYVRDRSPGGTTVLASRSLNSVGGDSLRPAISGDGRWVGFDSLDEQLVVGDVGGFVDVFRYDRVDKTVTLVSRNDADEQANAPSGLVLGGASVSANGNLVLFGSTASNLVAESSTGNQLYVRKFVDDTPPPAQVTFEWLAPVSDTFSVGRNLPVKFTVHDLDGAPVLDTSVQVDVVDSSDAVKAGTYTFGDQPSRSVTWSGGTYHVNVDTRDLTAGMYWLRVRFSSASLTAEFTLATNGTAGAVRSRLRD